MLNCVKTERIAAKTSGLGKLSPVTTELTMAVVGGLGKLSPATAEQKPSVVNRTKASNLASKPALKLVPSLVPKLVPSLAPKVPFLRPGRPNNALREQAVLVVFRVKSVAA